MSDKNEEEDQHGRRLREIENGGSSNVAALIPLPTLPLPRLALNSSTNFSPRSASSASSSPSPIPPLLTSPGSSSGHSSRETNFIAQILAKTTSPRKPRVAKKPIPDEDKDLRYYERRKRNNLAAKKSRDMRKKREDCVAKRASELEKENADLRSQMVSLREEMTTLQTLLLTKRLKGKTENSNEEDLKPSSCSSSPLAAIIMAMAHKNKIKENQQ